MTETQSAHSEVDEVLAGGGELGARMRAIDWSTTPLGPVASWPQSLRSALSVCLGSRFPIAIYWGAELTLLYNDAWSPIPGAKHPWALGRPALEVWPEIWDAIGPLFAKVMSTGEGTYAEDSLLAMARHGYTEECYFNYSFTPIRGEGGRVEGVFNAVIETTFRVIAERRNRALRDLGARLVGARTPEDACARAAEVLATAPEDAPFCALYLVDEPARGARLAGASGVSAASPAAPSRIDFTHDAPWPLGALRRAEGVTVLRGLSARFGASLPSGPWPEPVDAALVAPLRVAAAGEVTGFLILGASPRRAIDDEYRLFAERAAAHVATAIASAVAYELERRRAEALAAIDRAKTEFFSNVSHEFRTPLTLLLGPIEDALSTGSGALSGEDLQTVHRNALRLLRLVNSLLDFSRIEAGRARASYAPTELSTLTADLASAFRAAVEKAGLTLTVDCPPLREAVYVDASMWEKVVLNLLSNAFKFTFEGGITVSLREVDGRARLSVTDTGTGIPAHALPHLFERFHRVEGSRSRSFEGSGIGLALVHELVRLHGGTINVESELDRGTTVTVSLPFGAAHLPAEQVAATHTSAPMGALPFVEEALRWLPDPPAEVTPSDLPPPSAASTAERPRVLLADDNADMRDYLRRLLDPRFEVESVTDGEAALAAARARPPELVLSDVMMPRLDGFGLLRALRGDPSLRGVPVILLSARAGDESRVEGLEVGADDYLVKPFSARELLARVSLHLELSRARAEVERQRRTLHEVFAQAPVAIAAWRGPSHVFVLANPRYEEMFGRRDLVGRSVREVFSEPEVARAGVWEVFDRAYASGEVYEAPEFELRWDRDGDGSRASGVFAFTLAPMRDAAGVVEGLLAVAVDVTEQVRARREVERLAGERAELLGREKQARAAAERANRLKDEFLATMSHELRTPLNAIFGWARILRAEALPKEKQAKALETIERNARTQVALIEDVLDVSRIVSGKLRLTVGVVDLSAVVQAAVDTVRPAAEARGVRLQLLIDPHAGVTMGDPNRLQQVVWNLLSNAVKFTPKGGRVHVRLMREESSVEVVVADTGQGIPPEFLPYVFERFRQADATITRTHGGLGLGLSIVKHLVEMHGGTVHAESEGLGRGATFTVRVPVAPVRRSDRPPSVARSSAGEGLPFACPPGVAGLRVLVVDDEPDARELVEAILSQCGVAVSTAGSVSEALARFEAEAPDVLVSDIGMPGEDGYALIRAVRALPADSGGRTPAIALTAYARMEDRTRALTEGFTNHVAKPVEPQELLAVISAVAGRFTPDPAARRG